MKEFFIDMPRELPKENHPSYIDTKHLIKDAENISKFINEKNIKKAKQISNKLAEKSKDIEMHANTIKHSYPYISYLLKNTVKDAQKTHKKLNDSITNCKINLNSSLHFSEFYENRSETDIKLKKMWG